MITAKIRSDPDHDEQSEDLAKLKPSDLSQAGHAFTVKHKADAGAQDHSCLGCQY